MNALQNRKPCVMVNSDCELHRTQGHLCDKPLDISVRNFLDLVSDVGDTVGWDTT